MNDIQTTFLNRTRVNTYSNREFYKNIYKNGIYYGYPKCCINSYISHHYNEKSFTHLQMCVSAGTGFIPCLNHAQELCKRNNSIISIISKRECPFDFPYDEE